MSEYGEVKDLLDKIKLYSNLRIQAQRSRSSNHMKEFREAKSLYDESDEVLGQIEKDLELLMHAYDALRYSAGRST